ncbi:hypothetical protein NKV55_000625 [Acinetobacter baumannii]
MDNVIDANKDIKKQATELLKKAHGKVSNVPPVIPVKLTTYTHSLTIFIGGAADKYVFTPGDVPVGWGILDLLAQHTLLETMLIIILQL